MKVSLSLLALTSAVALAAPFNHKREVVLVTSTTEVVETVYSTTTIWVQPTSSSSKPSSVPAKSSASASASAKPNTGGEFYEKTAVAQPAPVPSSSQAPEPAPEPTSQAAPAPVVETPEAVPTPAAPSVEQAQAAPTPQAQSSAEFVPVPSSSSSSSGSGSSAGGSNGATVYTGEITYYDPGMGSCGITSGPNDMIVAVAHRIMANGANPNANPLCGKTVTIDYEGTQTTATIVDTCPGCSGDDLDLSPALFKAVAPNGDGRVAGVKWWIN